MGAAASGGRPQGILALEAEMARQFADARASLVAQPELVQTVADRLASTGRLLMLGMGASHWTNRIVLGFYRQVGLDAHADVLSDQIRRPSPPSDGRVTLIASQSGASGEVAAYFSRLGLRGDHFGLTLNRESLLARRVPSLIAAGPPEKAFAATRSIMVTLALHAAILHRLGCDLGSFAAVLDSPPPSADLADIPHRLARCRTFYLTGRSTQHSVMEALALTTMELARLPALAMETGQLIHGPLEAVDEESAVLVARAGDAEDDTLGRLAARAAGFGATVVTLDNGECRAIENVTSVTLPPASGLGAAAVLLAQAQRLAAATAEIRVPEAGTPRRSTKVTDGEAL